MPFKIPSTHYYYSALNKKLNPSTHFLYTSKSRYKPTYNGKLYTNYEYALHIFFNEKIKLSIRINMKVMHLIADPKKVKYIALQAAA